MSCDCSVRAVGQGKNVHEHPGCLSAQNSPERSEVERAFVRDLLTRLVTLTDCLNALLELQNWGAICALTFP